MTARNVTVIQRPARNKHRTATTYTCVAALMLSNFFVLSPRGDTIISKQYRTERDHDVGAHERSHTEAFFRKIKFWKDGGTLLDSAAESNEAEENDDLEQNKGDAPPVFMMPDGLSYFHVKRNGLIFGCSTARNVSPTTVIDVSCIRKLCILVWKFCNSSVIGTNEFLYSYFLTWSFSSFVSLVTVHHCQGIQGLLWHTFRGSYTKEFHPLV